MNTYYVGRDTPSVPRYGPFTSFNQAEKAAQGFSAWAGGQPFLIGELGTDDEGWPRMTPIAVVVVMGGSGGIPPDPGNKGEPEEHMLLVWPGRVLTNKGQLDIAK
jgi:hypothetical protein